MMHEMRSSVVLITPELAKEWLKKSGGNRPINKSAVTRFKNDILSGRWQLTPQGIAFDENGVLKDGHHRLTAIVEANAPAQMYVTYGVPSSVDAFDIGKSRSTRQYLQYNAGVAPGLAQPWVIAMARMHFFFEGGESRAYCDAKSNAEIKEWIVKNADAISAIAPIVWKKKDGKRPLLSASVAYSIFCAFQCGVSLGRLHRFCEIMLTGFYDAKSETAAIVARNKLLDGNGGDINDRSFVCKVMQMALKDFDNGIPRSRQYDGRSAPYTEAYLRMEV